MTELNIGIAGLGTVGTGLLEILLSHSQRIKRAGATLDVSGLCARDRGKDRGLPLSDYEWFSDPIALAASDSTDIFVELIGGSDGPAYEAVSEALRLGKHVVTANKAMLAKHGKQLALLAEGGGGSLHYEAAVAAGIPIIRGLKDGASACRVHSIAGMLNGTCNYILSEMTSKGLNYDVALKQAQELGYAEADPGMDVGGIDAAQKLCILAMIAFDADVEYGSFLVQGIEAITAEDIIAAGKLGYRIKLLASARREEAGCELAVYPALVSEDHSLSRSNGAENYLIVNSDPLGVLTFAGPGAGKGATAAAVAADVISIARGQTGPVFNTPADNLGPVTLISSDLRPAQYYLRLDLKDVPGAIAGISEVLAAHNISIDSLIQPSVSSMPQGGALPHAMVVLATHKTTFAGIRDAAQEIQKKPFALGEPSIIRIADLS